MTKLEILNAVFKTKDGISWNELSEMLNEFIKPKPIDRYKFCNHYHEITNEHAIVDFGDGEFVANKMAIPLLKALNELGLKTRTHHIGKNGCFMSLLIEENTRIEIKQVFENDSNRDKYNGKIELIIAWGGN